MRQITTFEPEFARRLPGAHALLARANLVVHPAVERIAISGSRGPRDQPRPDSDVDLSLVVGAAALPAGEPERAALLRAVLETTRDAWRGAVECDLAAVCDERGCGLACFAGDRRAAPACPAGGECRFGIYKLQRGFEGYVPWEIIRLDLLYPLLEIWRREP